ncbi:ferredoxin [Streptomyces sp. MRC013]|uniref:ferredoxin n=1 Tax=Streptomyces sp. MRC013 TaxID=2898276 RepID=UPI002025FC19|nr:ferredoxin [Streptomyces sp. MRC013]URM92484.1 ferredoxin [Streptomyces sp. MRC013]
MTWTIGVDSGTCMGSGICAALAPDLFRLEDAYAVPVRTEIAEDERALDAADSCPALAIVVRDGWRTVGPRP